MNGWENQTKESFASGLIGINCLQSNSGRDSYFFSKHIKTGN